MPMNEILAFQRCSGAPVWAFLANAGTTLAAKLDMDWARWILGRRFDFHCNFTFDQRPGRLYIRAPFIVVGAWKGSMKAPKVTLY